MTTLDPARAFSSFAVPDIDVAARFYGETLGLSTESENGMLILHVGGGTDVIVYPKPDHVPATFTVLNFPVADVEAAVDELEGAGVEMQRYDGFPHDERGIARDPRGPAIAWFTDPAGNVLSVLEAPAQP